MRGYIHQPVRAVHCHQNNVVHRDIKPENMLVNLSSSTRLEDGQLKLCDFGFARTIASKDLTDYVSTRWYRAPELLIGSTTYGKAVDQWAIGCIMASSSTGSRSSRESDIDQLYIIQKVIGCITSQQKNEARVLRAQVSGDRQPPGPGGRHGGKIDEDSSLMTKLLRMNPDDRLGSSASSTCTLPRWSQRTGVALRQDGERAALPVSGLARPQPSQ